VAGVDMAIPLASTDYLMNANADGSGADLTSNFTVLATYGSTQVDYEITNNSATTPGYVTKLQARGRGLYDYDPLEAEERNEGSITAIGESGVDLDMAYQSEITVAVAVAEFLVATWSSHEPTPGEPPIGSVGSTEISVGFVPRDDAELLALMALEPAVPIIVREELAVVNDVYYIQGVELKIDGDSISFDFPLQRALVATFWSLGDAGFSELGETTVLAPL
jgi:hypothetical protein